METPTTDSSNEPKQPTPSERADPESASPFAETDPCSYVGTEPAEDPLSLDQNARADFWCRGQPIGVTVNLSNVEPWGDGRATVDQSAAVGSRSIRLQVSDSQIRSGIVCRFEDAVDLREYDVSVGASLGSSGNEGLVVQLCAPDKENLVQSTGYVWDAGWLRLDHGPTHVQGSPDLTDVRKLRIGTHAGRGNETDIRIGGVRATPRRDRGLVAFTFDDGHVTQYENAFPILRSHGFPGAVGAIPEVVGNDERMTLKELDEVRSAGWDVVSHPQHGGPLRGQSEDAVRERIVDTKRWLVDHGFNRGAQFIIWPFGQYGEPALSVANRYHRMGFAGANGVAGRITDPLVVPRADGEKPERSKRIIDAAAARRQLCVLRYHRIGDPESDYSVSESEFRSVVEHVAAADVDVVSVSDLWNQAAGAVESNGSMPTDDG